MPTLRSAVKGIRTALIYGSLVIGMIGVLLGLHSLTSPKPSYAASAAHQAVKWASASETAPSIVAGIPHARIGKGTIGRQAPARRAVGRPAVSLGAPVSVPSDLNALQPQMFGNLHYASAAGVDPKFLSLDIYAAPGASGRPVVVYVHGGGWTDGDKTHIGAKDKLFVGAGYVFASINYRLLPEGRHPVNVQDVAKALAWLHDRVADYGGDPAAIFVIGHSAGAHLSGLVSSDEQYLKAVGKSLSIIKGVVLLDSNAYDVPLLMPRLGNSDNCYSQAFGSNPAVWNDASPARHVSAGKGIAPALVVCANNDASRREQADNLARRLQEAGIRADLFDVPDRDHGSLCELLGKPGDATSQRILDFLGSLQNGGGQAVRKP